MAETSGLGRLGTEDTVLEARVQVLNSVPPTCSDLGDSPRDVVERQSLFRPEDPHSGSWRYETHSDEFQSLLEGRPVMTVF